MIPLMFSVAAGRSGCDCWESIAWKDARILVQRPSNLPLIWLSAEE